tara:strand:- start:152 stop:700 length:549 start_codon:yes stop_codon:yes gene_type:complete
MTKKKKTTLVNESVIRRWGKLADMPALTETYIDTLDEEEEEEFGGDEAEAELGADMAPAGEEELGAEEGGEVDPAEMEAVESIVTAVVDAISQETGVEIEVEGGAEEAEAGAEDLEAGAEDLEAGAEDLEAAAEEEAPASRDSVYNRNDKEDDEELNLEVLDDEALTEAVLKRVVTRLLRRK